MLHCINYTTFKTDTHAHHRAGPEQSQGRRRQGRCCTKSASHPCNAPQSHEKQAVVLSLRQTLYLPLDDLLYITRQYINADVSRSGIARLLKREGMARLEDVIPHPGRV